MDNPGEAAGAAPAGTPPQDGTRPSVASMSTRGDEARPDTPDAPAPEPAKGAASRGLPERVGRFRIIRRLGAGGMGSVYLAEDTDLGRQVALKVAHLDASDPQEVVERFKREARAAAMLDHPYLCPVHEMGVIDGTHYIIMAYIEGRSLADIIDKDGGLPPRQVAALVGKLAVALQEAHQRGVFHRDLKPSNVMIKPTSRGKEPVIVDFGLARRHDAVDRLTKTGQVVGTPHYMAPEQIRGSDDQLGGSCDIFALGVILYELLTGHLPFDGPTPLAVVAQILTRPPDPPTVHRANLDPRLVEICLKAMAKDPAQRYATMGDLATALTDFLRMATAEPAAPSGEVAAAAAPRPEAAAPRQTGSNTLMGQLLDRAGSGPAPIPAVELDSEPATLAPPEPRQPARQRAAEVLNGLRARHPRSTIIAAASVLGLVTIGAIGFWASTRREATPPGEDSPVAANHDGPDLIRELRAVNNYMKKNARPNTPAKAPASPGSSPPDATAPPPSSPPPKAAVTLTDTVRLFNGRDLTGLQETVQNPKGLAGLSNFPASHASWAVEAGVLRLQSKAQLGNQSELFHLTPRDLDLKDFRLRMEAMIDEMSRAILLVRNETRLINPRSKVWKAYAVSIHGQDVKDARTRSGTLSDFVNTGQSPRMLAAARGDLITPGRWFTLELLVRENHFAAWIDGRSVLDFIDRASLYDMGRISLLFDGPGTIRFRTIEVAGPDVEMGPVRKPEPASQPPIVAKTPLESPDVTAPPPQKKAEKPALTPTSSGPPVLVDEDFQSVPEGQLPKDWIANAGNVAVLARDHRSVRGPGSPSIGVRSTRPSGGIASVKGAAGAGRRPVLTLIDPNKQDYVSLPELKPELSEDFAVDCDFSIPSARAGIGIQLQGRARETLRLEVFGDGTVTAQGRPLNKGAYKTADNHVRLLRRGNDYFVELNRAPVGKIQINIGKVKFKIVRISLGETLPQPRSGTFGRMFVPGASSRSAQAPEILRIRVTPM